MSRIGKKPIEIAPGVQVDMQGQVVSVKGAKGELSREIPPQLEVSQQGNRITVAPRDPSLKNVKALWGTNRTLIENMIKGVSEGYEKKLTVEGVGYRAVVEGEELVLHVGFTHRVAVKAPAGLRFQVEKNVITVSGADKEKVGEYAARIRRVKTVEPYKGKGISYLGEVVKRKLGKRAVAATAGKA